MARRRRRARGGAHGGPEPRGRDPRYRASVIVDRRYPRRWGASPEDGCAATRSRRARGGTWLVLLSLVVACAAPEPRTSTPPPAATPAPSSSASALVVAPPTPGPPGPREVQSPRTIACTLTGPTAQPVSLFAPGESEPWATAQAVARFELPADGDGVPVVSGESRAIRFRAEARADAIPARFAVAHFFGGVFLPEGARPLAITRVAASGVSVRSKAPRFLVSSAAPFVATVPCGDLTVDIDAAPALGAQGVPGPRKAKMRALRPGTKIPLHADAGGDPAAVIQVGTDPALGTGPWVWISASSGDRTRIFLRDQDGVLAGWVPSDALLPLPPNKVASGHGGGGSAVGGLWGTPSRPATEPPVRVSCADEVELFVALGRDVHVVGRVLARAPMIVVHDDGERTRVAFAAGVLDAAERATVFVRTDALVGCARGFDAE